MVVGQLHRCIIFFGEQSCTGCSAVQFDSHMVERLAACFYRWCMVVHLGVQLWTIRWVGVLEYASKPDYHGVHRVSSGLSGPVDPSFRALSGRLKFTARRHQLKKSLSCTRCPAAHLFFA